MRRVELLEPTRLMLEAANGALELLARMATHTGQSAIEASRASAEARERIAAITANANEARRMGELAWNRRSRLLHLRLCVVRLETDHENIVDWFEKVSRGLLFCRFAHTNILRSLKHQLSSSSVLKLNFH